MLNGRLKIKNIIILTLIALIPIGVHYGYSLSQKTILAYEAIIAQYSRDKINIIPAPSETVKQFMSLSKNGYKKRIISLKHLPLLGFDESLAGVKSLLLYQPKDYKNQWFLSDKDTKDIKSSTFTLGLKNSILSFNRNHQVYLLSDNRIIISIRGPFAVYIIENEHGKIVFNVYSQLKSFEDSTERPNHQH